MNFHLTIAQALETLQTQTEERSTLLMAHGSMRIEYYAPQYTDPQTPHLQDEVYIIASGSAQFFRDGVRVSCNKGDVLFVPAGMLHRFEDFSDDFATWVIFYGPDGGEAGQSLEDKSYA